MRAGSPSIFVRFSGCNETCLFETHGFDCDTEFVSGVKKTLPELIEQIKEIAGPCRWVVLTGGEPGLQVDPPLLEALHAEGFRIAIETNGSIELPEGIDWITVSPKVAEHAIRQRKANEVKYVRSFGQGIPKTSVDAEFKLVSPAFQGQHLEPRTLEWCIELVKQNPEWRLTLQMHKLWKVR